MKIDQLLLWQSYLAVAKHGHFSRAALILKVPLPQVSKRVARLEELLGVRLFQRSTRRVALTAEGRSLLPKISSILEDLEEAEQLFAHKKELTGTLKITSVPFIAHRLLLGPIKKFLRLHPQIQLHLDLSENLVNIIDAGFDLAIRIETPKDSELVYRPLVSNDLIFCASASYLKGAPKLKRPEDLKLHPCLVMDIHLRCKFQKQMGKLGDFIGERKILCDHGAFLTEMALQGEGVLVRSKWDVHEHLKKGQLIELLPQHPLESFGQIYAVIPSKRFLAPRVRAFLDFLQHESKSWKA